VETQANPAAARRQRTIFGHPAGLYVLFLTQMWERFSYFGMLALLILYLNNSLKLPGGQAATIFKWYTSLIYFTPLLGGYLADRLLGNKRAVLIGAVLMAAGHLLMTFPPLPALFSALVLLVVGCGLLTPPLTSQVGLLYAPHDPRRDAGYTLFYMGINLGAFASPILCGWLVENTRGRYHAGFALAGFGMLLALATYLIGLRWVVELDQSAPATDTGNNPAPTSAENSPAGSGWSWLNRTAPFLLVALAAVVGVASLPLAGLGYISWDNLLGLELAALCALVIAGIARTVRGRERDQVLAIVALALFAILFWGGAGQSGNAINLWADQNTNRYLTRPAPQAAIFPEAAAGGDAGAMDSQGWRQRWGNMFRLLPAREGASVPSWGEWWASCWNPVPTAWFQSINPLLILLLAPFLALLWTRLGARGINPSIPTKMATGLLLLALAFVLMIGGAAREAQATSVAYPGPLPEALFITEPGQLGRRAAPGEGPHVYAAGRLRYDRQEQRLHLTGVLPDLARDEIVGATAPAEWVAQIESLQKQARADSGKGPGWAMDIHITRPPAGLDLRYAGFGAPEGNEQVRYNAATGTLTTSIILEENEVRGLKVAAGDPELRRALDALMMKSHRARVSPLWLAGFFLLATLGELCLSPIGLSMVSQLAPARFTSLLMSVWLLTFSFGNFLAGALGERWGLWAPLPYFAILAGVLTAGTLVLLSFRRPIGELMHGVE
jgi:POT family proton-dependent oligopeptide transporter